MDGGLEACRIARQFCNPKKNPWMDFSWAGIRPAWRGGVAVAIAMERVGDPRNPGKPLKDGLLAIFLLGLYKALREPQGPDFGSHPWRYCFLKMASFSFKTQKFCRKKCRKKEKEKNYSCEVFRLSIVNSINRRLSSRLCSPYTEILKRALSIRLNNRASISFTGRFLI